MNVNQQHEAHAESCSCDQSIFPTAMVPLIDRLGEDGWWDWHIQEHYEYMSPEFWILLGYNPEEMPNHPSAWQDKIFPEDLLLVLENYDKHKNGSTVYAICKGLWSTQFV